MMHYHTVMWTGVKTVCAATAESPSIPLDTHSLTND